MRFVSAIVCLAALVLSGCGDKESTVYYEVRSDVLPMDILLTDRDGFRTETTHESPWRKVVACFRSSRNSGAMSAPFAHDAVRISGC